MSVSEAAASESRLKALTELRDLIAKRLDQCNSDRDIAALSRQFVQITAEIDELKNDIKSKEVTLRDFRNKLKVVS